MSVLDRERAEAGTTPVSGEALLEFADVHKLYGPTAALGGVSLAVDRGCFVVLLGPSGSGKTTMLRCAAGIERITRGELRLGGDVVDDGRRQTPPERRDLAMVFQDYALWPHMTARQNVAYALRRRRLPSHKTDSLTADMLERVGLGELGGRYPSELSGGQQQRVALARALVAGPSLLLFDEPLSNLDANLRDRMRIEIALLVREAQATALYITHDQSEAFALADRVGVLNEGKLEQFGTPEAIYALPATPFVARLTGLAGELQARFAEPPRDGVAMVEFEGVTLAGRAMEATLSQCVSVLVRAAGVTLRSPDDAEAQLRGEVRDTAFRGHGYEHVVELAGGAQLSGIFSEERWERGRNVGVRLASSGCLLFSNP